MLKHNLSLFAAAAVIFTATVAVAAYDFDGTPDPDEEREYTRKSGDQYVYYGGRHYRTVGRTGSLGRRSFRGGGLHGGK